MELDGGVNSVVYMMKHDSFPISSEQSHGDESFWVAASSCGERDLRSDVSVGAQRESAQGPELEKCKGHYHVKGEPLHGI